MASWDDVAAIALSLPETAEGTSYGNRAWKARKKTFVWVRPLGKSDLDKLGPDAPRGEIMGARTENLEMKEAILASGDPAFFTIAHFDGYASVLVLIEHLAVERLRVVIADAWLSQAPPGVAAAFLGRRRP